ncbi:MAG: hypothetical protein QGI83_06195 [Candidatus Latescibacteria bacterium]|jgi:galactokinase|nr:hypothetical protein [Candidatus Latescibacterota bacterium]
MPEVADEAVPTPEFRTAEGWIRAFEKGGAADAGLKRVYGDDAGIVEHRRAHFAAVLAEFCRMFGKDREVTLVRCPARINLRGMHSEMQHASPNYLPHGREIIMVVERRMDDQVVVHSADAARFPPRSFRVSEEIARGNWGNWVGYIESEGVRRQVESARGDWSNYLKAAVLVLQHHVGERKLSGMNVMCSGDIPIVGGMSSSSAMVVASALGYAAVNQLDMGRKELVILLGQGEWYVGTRGGFGDHGAMLLGRYGTIVHTPFLSVEKLQPEYIEFPADHQILIVNSYKTSIKSAEQLFAYNQTMFSYSMALTLIKDAMAQMGEKQDLIDGIEYLGQITTEDFGSGLIYRILRALPERASIDELKARHPQMVENLLGRFFGQLGRYPEYLMVRGPGLWGIAESERSRAFARLIRESNIAEAGELMYIGQDGDRLFEFDADMRATPYTDNQVTDGYLDGLLADLASSDPERQKGAELARQPGNYNCSSLELDRIVEVLRRTPGVVGASLTGAGFGGIVLAIVRKDDATLKAVGDALVSDYYEALEDDEIAWITHSTELVDLLGAAEHGRVVELVQDIVGRKRAAKEAMDAADIGAADEIRNRINALFAEGRASRQMLFIPADYYTEGVVRHVPVDGAGAFVLS